MRVTRCKRWVRRHQVRFEGLSETSAAASELIFACPRSQRALRLAQCTGCPSFVNIRPRPEQGRVDMRCLYTDDEPIVRSAEMRPAWPTVGPEVHVRAARRLQRAHAAPLLLVVRDGELLGVLYS
jgi:hypothetical protein